MRQVLGESTTAGSLRRKSRSSDVIPRAAQVPGVFSDPWALIHRNSGVQATITAEHREPCLGRYPAVPCRTSVGGDKKRPNALIRLAVPRCSVLSLDPSVVPDLEQVH